MRKEDIIVSIVLILDNQINELSSCIEKLTPYLECNYSDFEIVIIDQNSADIEDGYIDKILTVYQSIRYLRLAQQVSSDVALAAGIENAIGDYVIHLNLVADPLSLIKELVVESKRGSDIVIGVSESSTTALYRSMRYLSNKLIHSIGYTLPANSTGSLCLNRRAVNAITESGRFYCKLHMRMANVGLVVKAVSYEPDPALEQKDVCDGIKTTLHHMVFNSTKPLRWMSVLGMFGSLMALVFAFYSLIVNVMNDNVMAGWTTTVLFMSFFFLILFTMLAFFGEYLARLLDDKGDHKEYNVVFEKNSSVMLDENRYNVLFTSTSDDIVELKYASKEV